MSLIISVVSVYNSFLRMVSESTHSWSGKLEIEHPPLFVIGHWRTGTTWLHELLVKDDRFTYPTTYQCMAPHHFLLTDWLFSGALNWLMPAKRPMDNMPVGMSRPQEDEFALMNLGVGSPYLEWAFPNRNQRYDEFLTLTDLDESVRQDWKSQFEWFVQRLSLHESKRIVLKSPTHTARVATLLEIFPDAQFILVVRNPLDTIPSTIRTWTRMTDSLSLQVRRDPISEDRILDVFQLMHEQFEKDRPLIPPKNFYELRYEDLVAEPLSELERIYEHLNLGDFADARPEFEDYLASIDGYQRNRHVVKGELKEKIRTRCRSYSEKYGYVTD